MSTLTLYHNPRCSKSRQALQLLEEKGQQVDVLLYLDTPPSGKQLEALLAKLGMSARELMRKGEEAYKVNKLADESLSEAQLIDAMVANPQLIERPILEVGDRAVVGRPPERVLELL